MLFDMIVHTLFMMSSNTRKKFAFIFGISFFWVVVYGLFQRKRKMCELKYGNAQCHSSPIAIIFLLFGIAVSGHAAIIAYKRVYVQAAVQQP